MKNFLLLIFTIVFVNISYSQTYTNTQSGSCNTTGCDFDLTFPSTPVNVTGAGTLSLAYFGDLDLSTEFFTLFGEGSINLGDYEGSSQCGNYTATVSLTQAQIATWAANGNIVFTFDGSSTVSSNICSSTAFTITSATLSYPYTACTPPTAITGNTLICEGQTSDLDAGEAEWTGLPTGGTISTIGQNERVHTFTSSSTFNTPQAINTRVLVVGGGGAGGRSCGGDRASGGGGGGGVVHNIYFAIGSGNTNVTVGNGGSGTLGSCGDGTEIGTMRNGQNSVFGTIIAYGGGGGGNGGAGMGASGGCGGGSGRDKNYVAVGTQGGNGGAGHTGGDRDGDQGAGGGGGAGGVGVSGVNNLGGAGGPGILNDISGSNVYYAAGGGGAGGNKTGGAGGTGGGGAGRSGSGAGYNATGIGCGGGGASKGGTYNGGNGSKGTVIARYYYPKWVSSNTSVATINSLTGEVTAVSAGTANITYYNICDGASITKSVTVLPSSTAPTSISGVSSSCPGSSVTLTQSGGSLAGNDTYVWYEGSCNTAYTQNWNELSFNTTSTTVNSVSDGILNVTSTNGDPMIRMENFSSFNPNIYKYINIRYRVTSGNAGLTEIFFTNAAHSSATGTQRVQGSLISDGNWHTLSIDMSTHTNWTNSNITGWRYDWATNSGVTMDLDYITLDASPIIGDGSSITVYPSTASTYSVKINSDCTPNSCVSKTISMQTLSNAPTSISGTSTICDGGNTTLTQNGGNLGTSGVYKWYTSSCGGTLVGTGTSINVSPSSTTEYFVRAEGNCNITSCVSKTVTVDAQPTAADAGPAGNICLSDNVMAANNPSVGTGTWSWSGPGTVTYNGGTNSNSHNANVSFSASGTYTGTWTISNGVCTNSTDDVVLTVNAPTTITTVGTSTATCESNGVNNWVHLFKANGEVIASVNDGGLNMGEVTVTVPTVGNASPSQVCSGGMNAYLGRYFRFSSTTAWSGNITVRLYFTNAELASLMSEAGCGDANGCADDDDVCSIGDIVATKYTTGVAPGSAGGVLLTQIGNGTDFGGNYVDFLVNGFSDIYLHGSEHNVTLPVELTKFEADVVRDNVQLSWTTATEINNEGFEIERSINGLEFNYIGYVYGNGNSTDIHNYEYIDDEVSKNITYYYRLKQMDYDGQFEYSSIVSARIGEIDDFAIGTIIPNPSKENVSVKTNIQISSNEIVNINIYNTLGVIVGTDKVNLQSGNNEINIATANLSSGTYFINFEGSFGRETKKLVIVK